MNPQQEKLERHLSHAMEERDRIEGKILRGNERLRKLAEEILFLEEDLSRIKNSSASIPRNSLQSVEFRKSNLFTK